MNIIDRLLKEEIKPYICVMYDKVEKEYFKLYDVIKLKQDEIDEGCCYVVIYVDGSIEYYNTKYFSLVKFIKDNNSL